MTLREIEDLKNMMREVEDKKFFNLDSSKSDVSYFMQN